MKDGPMRSQLVLGAALCLTCLPASATVIFGEVTGGESFNQGGGFVKLVVPFTLSDPDNTVGNDNFNTPDLYALDELQNVELLADLDVDILADGIGGGGGSGVIAAGTTVASHYVFFDPLTTTLQEGNISFDSNILGIITSDANLNASNVLANPDVTYSTQPGLGLEPGDDTVEITSLTTLSIDWGARTPGDYIRVITEFSPGAVIPVPAAVWLFGSAIGLLGFMRGRLR
jgi:hypothetical protein